MNIDTNKIANVVDTTAIVMQDECGDTLWDAVLKQSELLEHELSCALKQQPKHQSTAIKTQYNH